MTTHEPGQRAQTILAGDIRAASRLMRDLDDRIPGAIDVLKALYPHTGQGYIIGITGNPGAGKSTLVDALISAYRGQGLRVGVVAVDPTSPFSGGAILGDRIRMQRHALDEGVFVRSLATRGHLGGLSRSTFDVVCVLDAMGYDRILVETVGVGQDEIEIMRTAYTSVVVTVPGLGDDVQALKAGLLEIADVLVVNKSDREGADRTMRDLMHMLELRGHGGAIAPHAVEIVKTVATHGVREGSGVTELVAAIDHHRDTSWAGEEGRQRMRVRAAAHLAELVKGLLSDRVEAAMVARGGFDEIAAEVADRRVDPYSAAESLVASV
jgi:LAO/AO transport system kinase